MNVITMTTIAGSDARAVSQSCRFCSAELEYVVLDLGASPLCESFLTEKELAQPESTFPLIVYACDECSLVQVLDFVDGESIFGGDYAYFSSYSDSWLEHASDFARMAICLLYTSPSPRDKRQSRMPSSA